MIWLSAAAVGVNFWANKTRVVLSSYRFQLRTGLKNRLRLTIRYLGWLCPSISGPARELCINSIVARDGVEFNTSEAKRHLLYDAVRGGGDSMTLYKTLCRLSLNGGKGCPILK